MKNPSLKQKIALNYVNKETKLTQIDNEILSNTFTPYYPSLAYDRFLKGMVLTASRTPLPVITNFAVTSKCPCNCWHCSFADRSKKDNLSFTLLQKTIKDLQDMGTAVIGITGYKLTKKE